MGSPSPWGEGRGPPFHQESESSSPVKPLDDTAALAGSLHAPHKGPGAKCSQRGQSRIPKPQTLRGRASAAEFKSNGDTGLETDTVRIACPEQRREGQRVHSGDSQTRCVVGKPQGASQGDLWPPKGCSPDGQLTPGLSGAVSSKSTKAGRSDDRKRWHQAGLSALLGRAWALCSEELPAGGMAANALALLPGQITSALRPLFSASGRRSRSPWDARSGGRAFICPGALGTRGGPATWALGDAQRDWDRAPMGAINRVMEFGVLLSSVCVTKPADRATPTAELCSPRSGRRKSETQVPPAGLGP